MAKRRRSSSSSKPIIIRERVAASSRPVVVRVPRAAPIKKHRRRSHRSHGGGIGGGATGAMSLNRSGALALGGFLYGFIEKQFGAQIPSIPVLGKSGAIALGAYWLGGKSAGIVADIGNAASVIAGYSFGSTGRVSGLAPQVSGVAAQI